MKTDFIHIEKNPPPAGAQCRMEKAPGDGAPLRVATFPAPAATKGAVVLVTGWSEFIEKYFETIGDLHALGYDVAMMDWRGQGLSDRESPEKTNWIGYFDRLTEDLRFLADDVAAAQFEGPLTLLTHSMGGMPALKLLARGEDRFRRAVLCAPLTRLFPAMTHMAFRAAAEVAGKVGQAQRPTVKSDPNADRFDGNIYTSDAERHARFQALRAAEPAATVIGPTYGWARAVMRESDAIHRPGFFSALKTPVRIISAGEEQRVDGADHAVIAAKNPLIEHVVIDGALHEIMMERDPLRQAFWDAFDRT